MTSGETDIKQKYHLKESAKFSKWLTIFAKVVCERCGGGGK